MKTFVVRVWVPDRPGAFGAVASRIGGVRGDLVGIEIVDRGAGRAIDELVVELPDEVPVPLLVSEINQVDGVDVEEIHPLAGTLRDPRLDALEAAAVLVEATTPDEVLEALAAHARHDFEADWVAVCRGGDPLPLVSVGETPAPAWLRAFVEGSRLVGTTAGPGVAPPPGVLGDIAWEHVALGDITLLLGRQGRPFHARERRQAGALARIAGARYVELQRRRSRVFHPSAGARCPV
jgi:hypothetical protein